MGATAGTALLTPATSVAEVGSAASTKTPLRVSMQTLAPAVVPEKGRVTVTGQITNRSSETWTDLKTYLFTSSEPMTTRAELAKAALSSEELAVGNRHL